VGTGRSQALLFGFIFSFFLFFSVSGRNEGEFYVNFVLDLDMSRAVVCFVLDMI
jgi:hypothetical protein